MAECVVQPERVVYLGIAKVRHVMPECHVQVYYVVKTAQGQKAIGPELREIESEQKHFRDHWNKAYDNPDYGRFRIDLMRRILRDGIQPTDVAQYLRANQEAWPAYSFDEEIAYWEARAAGYRPCEHCGGLLKPIPACECGCQRPLKGVGGWSTMGYAVKSSSGASAALSRSDPPTPPSPGAPAPEEPAPW